MNTTQNIFGTKTKSYTLKYVRQRRTFSSLFVLIRQILNPASFPNLWSSNLLLPQSNQSFQSRFLNSVIEFTSWSVIQCLRDISKISKEKNGKIRKSSIFSVKKSFTTPITPWFNIFAKEDKKINSNSKRISSRWHKKNTILWYPFFRKSSSCYFISQLPIQILLWWVIATAKETSSSLQFYFLKKNKGTLHSSVSSLSSCKQSFKISKISTSHKGKLSLLFWKNISFTWSNLPKIQMIFKFRPFKSNLKTILSSLWHFYKISSTNIFIMASKNINTSILLFKIEFGKMLKTSKPWFVTPSWT